MTLSVPGRTAVVADVDLIVYEPEAADRTALVDVSGASTGVADLAGLEEHLGGGATVVILGPSVSRDGALAHVAPVLQASRSVGAVLVTETITTELLQMALRSGVNDVLPQPVDAAALQEAVTRIAASVGGSATASSSSRKEGPRGRVITVFSTKGGAGKSMLAVNVAVSMARSQSQPVILVDADLQFGDLAVMLKMAPQHTIVDAVNSIDRLDAGYLENLLITHEPSGIRVLPAPLEPAFADQIGAPEMARIIDLLREMGAYVVVDTPAYFNEIVLTLIEESDDVLLVAGMDIPNIKNVKIGLQTLRLLNTPMSKIHLVLNRANSKVKLDVGEVERTLQVKADAQIPSDVVVPQSVNKGVPVVIDSPKSGVAKAIEAYARTFVTDASNR